MFVHTHKRGMSFVEVIVAAAILVLVFGGLFTSFQLMISLIGKAKASSGALALANERMEFIRSIPYNDIGTVGGIPEGAVPETSTTTLNGIEYEQRVLIAYVDDPDDGEGVSDENGIVSDYKLVKVTYTWDFKGSGQSLSLISNIVPAGIETTEGGGTLVVNVFDAVVGAVSDAEVHIYNDTGTTTIDTTRFTNAEGKSIISGAPALANYEVTVTKDGYSIDRTYSVSPSNPNPATPHVAVLESEVSTMNFQIDVLSDLTLRTVGEPTVDHFTDTFTDGSLLNTTNNTEVIGGALALTSGPSGYNSSGTVTSSAITPSTFSAWDTVTFSASTPASTALTIHIYSVALGVETLIPDIDLPGNSAGFTAGTISLSALNVVTYPSLALGAALSTSDASSTPEVLEWDLGYVVSEPPISGESILLTGSKSIGTTALGEPIYKYKETHVSNGSGLATVLDMEWDIYEVVLSGSGYDISEACGYIPYALSPDVSETLSLTLVSSVSETLRVRVEDTIGAPVAGATINLTRPSISESSETSACGQSFFNDSLPVATDYQVEVIAAGYVTDTVTDISISGDVTLTVILSTL